MGIGGGNMMMIYLRESKTMVAIDSREVAPLNANETMLLNNSKAGNI
jgi:gamma-glutamyltranspeptidase